jgi:hypothetical protein
MVSREKRYRQKQLGGIAQGSNEKRKEKKTQDMKRQPYQTLTPEPGICACKTIIPNQPPSGFMVDLADSIVCRNGQCQSPYHRQYE